MSRSGRGELYAALAAIGYGSAYVATAFALRSFGPLSAAVWRSVVAAVGLAVVLAVTRRATTAHPTAGDGPAAASGPQRWTTRRALHLVVIAGFAGPIFLGAMNLAVAGVGPTVASFVAGLYAVLAAVFAPFLLAERLRRRALAGFLTALVGTALLAELDLGGPALGGIAWGLVAAVSFALFLNLSRRWARQDGFDGLTVGLATTSLTVVGLGVLVLLTESDRMLPAGLTPAAVLAILWLGFVAAAGQVLAVASTRLVAAARTAAFLLLNPVTATILSFALLGERPSPVQVLGGALVLAGIGIATIQRPVRVEQPSTATV